MKRVVACLVLAVAVTGCGGGESGWQDEWRDRSRQFVNDPELTPTAELRQACMGVEIFDPKKGGYEGEEYELALPVYMLSASALDDSGQRWRSRAEILADYGVEETDDVYFEAVEIVLDEIKRACEFSWQDKWREQRRQDLNNPEWVDPVELLQVCAIFDEDGGRGLVKQEVLATWALESEEIEHEGPGQTLTEILADYGVTENAKIVDEAVEIAIDEIERACP